jgi:pilus assembly protein CpaE
MINEAIRVLLVVDEDVDRSLVEAALPAGATNVTGLVYGFDLSRPVDDAAAQILIVACGAASQEAADLIRSWSSEHPDRPAVAVCESVPEYFVETLFRAGADDVVKLPETPERVLFTLEKALARHHGREVEGLGELAPMICVLGPKGGTGKTVTASNLAVAFASAGSRTAVVDIDLQFGDVGLALGLHPERTVYDLATSGGALDAEKLEAYLVDHESGARALLAPVRPDQASAVTTELMRSVYTLLRTTHDVVVVDTPPDFTPHVIAAVDVSSHLCVVGTLDSLSLKNTKLGLETLELMGYEPSAVSLVLNRANTSVGLSTDDVAAILGRKPDVLVPSDRAVPRSLNEGTPIVLGRKRSAVRGAYCALAEHYRSKGVGSGVREATSSNGVPAFAHRAGGEAEGNGSQNGHSQPSRRFRLIRGRGE